MYRIIDKRGTGKTSRLLLLAKENNGCIVCRNPESMQYKADRYGIIGVDIYSYNDLAFGKIKTQHQPIYIDEIEMYLYYLNENIQGYTLTNED